MPELFPDPLTLVLSALVLLGGQFIYATVGFGAGMFSIALLALILPDLAQPVAIILVLSFLTEVWVLARNWRKARGGLLLGLLPTSALGMWIGTELLAAGNVDTLKRSLGVFVGVAGAWFLFAEVRRERGSGSDAARAPRVGSVDSRWRNLLGVPVGLVSGVLGGLYGTGGPPVIVFLKGYGLDKSAFRATLLWYFLLMSGVRGGTYLSAGLLTGEVLLAAAWLLPASLLGTFLGARAHGRLSERWFGHGVSLLLILLGVLLFVGASRG